MANIEKYAPLLFRLEGGYVNDPDDRGGATNLGVTLQTWKETGYDKNGDGRIDEADLRLLTREDVIEYVLRPHYWNRWQADRIDNQSIANLLVDWVWHSGSIGITHPQWVLNVKTDGIVGEKTLAAINSYYNPKELFRDLKQAREEFILVICRNRPANNRFKKGWLNRLKAFSYHATVCLLLVVGMSSCRSSGGLHKEQESTKSEWVEVVGTQHGGQSSVSESAHRKERIGDEIRQTETLTIRYDTSAAPDPETKQYPVSERVRTVVTSVVHTWQSEQDMRRDTTEQWQAGEYRAGSALRQESKEKLREWRFPIRETVAVCVGLCLVVMVWRVKN